MLASKAWISLEVDISVTLTCYWMSRVDIQALIDEMPALFREQGYGEAVERRPCRALGHNTEEKNERSGGKKRILSNSW
jgi:hypothetical protein